MKLSIIIVNYNVKYYVEQCLNSVLRAVKGIEAEVIVVDNHSKDGSVEYLKSHFPEVNVVASNHNLGFARANNGWVLGRISTCLGGLSVPARP